MRGSTAIYPENEYIFWCCAKNCYVWKKVPGVLKLTFFSVLKPEVLHITSVSYNVLLLSMFGVLQNTETKTPEYVFLVLKNSTLTSPRDSFVIRLYNLYNIPFDWAK